MSVMIRAKDSGRTNMTTVIFKEFTFAAAHCLKGLDDGHPCTVLHGHNYKVRLEIEGTPDPQTGMVMDFAKIKEVVAPLIEQLDHSTLNDSMPVTTSECLAAFFADRLRDDLTGLRRVEVRETPTCGAIVYL